MRRAIKLDVRISVTPDGTTVHVLSDYTPISAAFESRLKVKIHEALRETILGRLSEGGGAHEGAAGRTSQ